MKSVGIWSAPIIKTGSYSRPFLSKWTCGRLLVCSSGCWNIRDHRFGRMLPFNWYRPPHFEGHQWSPPDVLHLSADFSCHHLRQRPGYYSLIKEICPGVGWETLTVKMVMHCYVYITLISCIQNKHFVNIEILYIYIYIYCLYIFPGGALISALAS